MVDVTPLEEKLGEVIAWPLELARQEDPGSE